MFIPSTFKRPVSSWKALRSEERFSRNAETDLVCRLLLEIKKGNRRSSPSPWPPRRLHGCTHSWLTASSSFSSFCVPRALHSFPTRRSSDLVYGTLDFVGYPRFPAPVEFIAAVIAYYVHPVNIQTACLIMEGAEFTENIINGVERPVKAAELFAFTLRVRAGNTDVLTD